MKNWFSRLMALLRRDQTRTSPCMDWRGRPLGTGAEKEIPPVELAEAAPYTTLRLPSFPEPSSADPR
jgi:hypothetical protein